MVSLLVCTLLSKLALGLAAFRKRANLPEPTFQKESIFTVILNRPKKASEKTTQKTAQKKKDKILEILTMNLQVSRFEMAEVLGDAAEDGFKYQRNKLRNKEKQGEYDLIKMAIEKAVM